MKNELRTAIKTNNKAAILEILDPIIEKCSEMLIAGVLKKNVVRFLENNSIKGEAAENIAEVATVRAENFMASKAA